MHFSRVRLENWRNFTSSDVPLQNRAFLVGANATGKSNFLDALRFLRDIVLEGGGFQEAVRRRGGVSALRSLHARSQPAVALDVDLNEGDALEWRYRLVFDQDTRKRPLLLEEHIWHGGILLLSRPDGDDRADAARLRQTLLEQTFANREFRAVADFFRSITYWHVVPQLVRDPERSIGRTADPFGGDFLEQIGNAAENSRKARLRRIEAALQIAVPSLTSLQWQRDQQGTAHLRTNDKHWRPQGAWQTELELSDGTLRLIGLLWALQDGRGPLLLEEPELSLHPGIVRHLSQMMLSIQRQQKLAFRQTFVSTHSSDLLNDEGIAPDEVLLFLPDDNGTQIRQGAALDAVLEQLNARLPLGEIVNALTEPANSDQLLSFER